MGKQASAPPVPDYVGAAKQQGQDNLTAAKQSNIMSNPNMYTPYGNQTVTYSSPTFDQSGFDAATAKYNAGNVDRNQYYKQDNGSSGGEGGGSGGTYFDQTAYDAANSARGAAPTRESFTSGGGQPTITQTLTPQAQQTLDAQQRVQTALANLGQTGVNNANSVLSSSFVPTTSDIQHDFGGYQNVPTGDQYGLAQAKTAANTYGLAKGDVPLQYSLDTSNLAAMPINAGTKAQDLILQRLNPTIEAGDTSFKQALANQGLAPGTQAFDTAMRNREMSKNDLYNQAALQGINLDMAARQQGLNEQNTLGSFANAAQLSGAGLYNSAVGQNFGQGVTADQLANSAIGQNFNQGITSQSQQYNQALAKAQFQNTAQQQQLAQDLQLRSQPLNEIIGLMGGSQIQMPQFQGYQGASVAAAPSYNAVQQQYQGALGQANAQNAANNSLTSGLFSLGGSALMAPTGTFGGLKGLFG